MLAILVVVTIFAFWGTLKNRRTNNTFGAAVGGLFSVVLAAITVLAALITFGVVDL